MLLSDFLGYGTIRTQIKIQDIDTFDIIYQGYNTKTFTQVNYKVSYYKIEDNYIYIGVYKTK